jgi:hypothetical protein
MNRHVKRLGTAFFGGTLHVNSRPSALHFADAASELTDMFPCGYIDLPASASYARPVYQASCITED